MPSKKLALREEGHENPFSIYVTRLDIVARPKRKKVPYHKHTCCNVIDEIGYSLVRHRVNVISLGRLEYEFTGLLSSYKSCTKSLRHN